MGKHASKFTGHWLQWLLWQSTDSSLTYYPSFFFISPEQQPYSSCFSLFHGVMLSYTRRWRIRHSPFDCWGTTYSSCHKHCTLLCLRRKCCSSLRRMSSRSHQILCSRRLRRNQDFPLQPRLGRQSPLRMFRAGRLDSLSLLGTLNLARAYEHSYRPRATK